MSDVQEGTVRIATGGVERFENGAWVLQETLGLGSRPNLAQLRRDWIGRFVLVHHPDGRPYVQGFVDEFAMVAGEVKVHMDNAGWVRLDRHSTMVHDWVGRPMWLEFLIFESAQTAVQLASARLRDRAGELRRDGQPGDASLVERCAELVDGSAIPVAPTQLVPR